MLTTFVAASKYWVSQKLENVLPDKQLQPTNQHNKKGCPLLSCKLEIACHDGFDCVIFFMAVCIIIMNEHDLLNDPQTDYRTGACRLEGRTIKISF